MVWKILTNTVQMVNRASETLRTRQIAVAVATTRQVAVQTSFTQETRNVAQKAIGMHELRIAYIMQHLPRLTPELTREFREHNLPLLEIITEEEEAKSKRANIPLRETELERRERRLRTRLERVLDNIERIIFERPVFGVTELTTEAMLEHHLWDNYHDQILLALTNLILASEQRNLFIKPLGVSEGFQRFAMEYYMPYYMALPMKHNLLGVKVTPLSLLLLEGRHASSYVTGTLQGQEMKTKSLIVPSQARALRAKVVSSGKRPIEPIPTVSVGDEHEKFSKNDYIPIFHDVQGKDMITVTILDAVIRRYLIKVWGARMVGYPEGYAFWQYPHVAVIVTRRGMRIRYKKRFLVPRWAEHIAHYYIKGMRKFREVHGFYRKSTYRPIRRRYY